MPQASGRALDNGTLTSSAKMDSSMLNTWPSKMDKPPSTKSRSWSQECHPTTSQLTSSETFPLNLTWLETGLMRNSELPSLQNHATSASQEATKHNHLHLEKEKVSNPKEVSSNLLTTLSQWTAAWTTQLEQSAATTVSTLPATTSLVWTTSSLMSLLIYAKNCKASMDNSALRHQTSIPVSLS